MTGKSQVEVANPAGNSFGNRQLAGKSNQAGDRFGNPQQPIDKFGTCTDCGIRRVVKKGSVLGGLTRCSELEGVVCGEESQPIDPSNDNNTLRRMRKAEEIYGKCR